MTGKNQSCFDNFLSKEDLTGKKQSFFRYLSFKGSCTENYGINLDQKGSFTCQSFFYKKLLKKSWLKRFFYVSKALLQKIFKEILIKKVSYTSKVLLQEIIKETLIIKVLLQKIIEEILIKNELLLHSELISFEIWRKKNILFLWKKILFLSITNFSPDFYQLARLAEQNNSFLCKIFDQFFTYTICI